MDTNNWLNYTFAIIMLLFGIVLILMAFQADSNYDSTNCGNKNIRNCTMWVSMIASVLIVIPVFYLYVRKRAPGIETMGSLTLYSVFSGILGLTLIILGGIMSTASSKDPCKPIKAQATTIWLLGLVLFLFAIFYGVYEGVQLYRTGGLKGALSRDLGMTF